jgi:hypothetical protein
MDDAMGIPIDMGPSLPATADHMELRRRADAEEAAKAAAADAVLRQRAEGPASARAPMPEAEQLWDDEEPTIVGDSPEVDEEAEEEGPTAVDMGREELRDIVAGVDAGKTAYDPDKTLVETDEDGDVIVRRVIAIR